MSSDADVIVLGGGLAGHCAALSAAEHGAAVTLYEKQGNYGGSTVQAGGFFLFAGTDLQKQNGIEDSAENMRRDLTKDGQNPCDMDLIDAFLEHQLESYEWLGQQGVRFERLDMASRTVPRVHVGLPGKIMDALHQRVMANPNIRYVDHVAMQRFVPTSSGKAVKGVIVQQGSGKPAEEVGFNRAVVIATGGFSRNGKMIRQFAPHLNMAVRMGGPGNSGDGIVAAFALGADHADMAYLQGSFCASLQEYPDIEPASSQERLLFMTMYQGGVIVNIEGRRFVNEALHYKVLGDHGIAQPRGIALQLFDADGERRVMESEYGPRYERVKALGLLYKADSLADLARSVHLDPKILGETIDRYNQAVETGHDADFGRPAQGFAQMRKIATPPFFAFPCTVGVTGTYCGLKVDATMHVQNVFGDRIGGLYAAGEAVGGFHGNGYVTGSALTKAIVFGRIAGKSAAGSQ